MDKQTKQASQPQSGITSSLNVHTPTSSLNVHTPHYQQDVPFEVPKNWAWCKLADIVHELKYGTSEKSSSVGKIAVLRMGNITNIGTIDYSNLVYSSNEEDIKQYSLEKGNLLFNRTNSSEWVGKTAIYKDNTSVNYNRKF